MKKPNVREASDDYGEQVIERVNHQLGNPHTHIHCIGAGKLANGLKNEENPQYAAMCFSAMAK